MTAGCETWVSPGDGRVKLASWIICYLVSSWSPRLSDPEVEFLGLNECVGLIAVNDARVKLGTSVRPASLRGRNMSWRLASVRL